MPHIFLQRFFTDERAPMGVQYIPILKALKAAMTLPAPWRSVDEWVWVAPQEDGRHAVVSLLTLDREPRGRDQLITTRANNFWNPRAIHFQWEFGDNRALEEQTLDHMIRIFEQVFPDNHGELYLNIHYSIEWEDSRKKEAGLAEGLELSVTMPDSSK